MLEARVVLCTQLFFIPVATPLKSFGVKPQIPLERQYAYMCVHLAISFQIYSKFIGSTLNHYLAKMLFQTYYSKKNIPVGLMTPGITF